jgi:hypothetical protein
LLVLLLMRLPLEAFEYNAVEQLLETLRAGNEPYTIPGNLERPIFHYFS